VYVYKSHNANWVSLARTMLVTGRVLVGFSEIAFIFTSLDAWLGGPCEERLKHKLPC